MVDDYLLVLAIRGCEIELSRTARNGKQRGTRPFTAAHSHPPRAACIICSFLSFFLSSCSFVLFWNGTDAVHCPIFYVRAHPSLGVRTRRGKGEKAKAEKASKRFF